MPFDGTGFEIETKPAIAEPWRRVLMDAADRIEWLGWTTSAAQKNPPGAVCAVLAMPCGDMAAKDDAIEHLAHYLGNEGLIGRGCIYRWNDAPGRAAAEVCATLRACAAS